MRPSEKNGSPQTHRIPDYRNPKCPIPPNPPLPFRWLLVCLLPLFTAVYFHFFPATPGSSGFLINGIILACECAFLFKYVLFALITHHLKGEFAYSGKPPSSFCR